MGPLEWGLIGISILFIITAIIILVAVINKKRAKKMNKDIEELFSFIKKDNPNEIEYRKIERPKKKGSDLSLPYDYILESKKLRYFIKIVPNLLNQEICVNNSVKWQLRRSFNDESLRFVEGIEGLMRLDLANDDKKNKKLYIIYPNARALLKYINECEMEFIHPNTDVYGTSIINYLALKENKALLKL